MSAGFWILFVFGVLVALDLWRMDRKNREASWELDREWWLTVSDEAFDGTDWKDAV